MEEIEAWVARDKDGYIFLHKSKPIRDMNEWYSKDMKGYISLADEWFPEVQWTDEEPTKVKIVIEK